MGRRGLIILIACAALGLAPAVADARTWFVRAGGTEAGQGTRSAPFARLASVEARSRRGDRIVILAVPRSVNPLDGGLKLKRGQRLVGRRSADRASRLTNTNPARLAGDAVRLASGAKVRRIEVAGAVRGGIYGLNVRGVVIRGTDVSGHNTSCTRGFHIPPFNVPTTAPGVGVPISDGLHNGWAGIMVDASRGRGRLVITRNRVHDGDCGDGIDVRLSGTARRRVVITRNLVAELQQGAEFESVLAFGLQTRERSRLSARLDRNRQRGLGNDEDAGAGPEGADSEGVFINPTGPSTLTALITRNSYTHTPGRGGFSANGLEFVSMGEGSRGDVTVRDSSFTGTPGDVLEQLALGTEARLRLRLERVVASGSTGFAGSGFGNTVVIPGNNGDCLVSASGGAGNSIDLVVRRTALTDCANNGLTFGSAVANGSGPTTALRLDLAGSRLTGNRGNNFRVGNISDLDLLEVKVQDTDLADSRGAGATPANASFENIGTTERATIDLGGGALGSRGGNCLDGGSQAAALLRYDVTARGNWWGQPGGPEAGQTVSLGGALDAGAALGTAPAGRC